MSLKEKFLTAIAAFATSTASVLAPLLIPIVVILSFDVIDYALMYRLTRKDKSLVMNRKKHTDRLIAHMAVLAVAFIIQSFMLKEQPVLVIAQGAIGITQVLRIRRSVKLLTGSDLIGELPTIEKNETDRSEK